MEHIDLMLDLETLSTDFNAVIIQLAAVPFHLNGTPIGPDVSNFNLLVNPISAVKAGAKVNGDTVEWWLKQDANVVNKVFVKAISEGRTLKEVLEAFTAYIEDLKKRFNVKQVRIWGNGIKADNVWVESSYKMCGLKYPVSFRDDADVRTLVLLGREFGIDFKDKIPFVGDKHNAIDDCTHQIKYLTSIYTEVFSRMNQTVVSSSNP